jgi:hypothetical protein
MQEKTGRSLLRLVDDPMVRAMQMLRQLPLESMTFYLEMISERADELGLLSDDDRARIAELVRQVSTRHIDRAA